MNDNDSLLIFSTLEESKETTRRERGWSEDSLDKKTNNVTVSVLKKNMDMFLNQVREILANESAKIGSFDIDEVEISAQITTDGKVALFGSGVSVGGSGGIKFILKRSGG